MRTDDRFPSLIILDHPLITHKLTLIRRKHTSTAVFRRLLKEIALLMGYEATRDLATRVETIETPLARMEAVVVDEDDVAIVSILRAGLIMAEGLHTILSGAREGHIGVFRDPETKQAIEYYTKLPAPETSLFLIADPMVATGSSSIHAVDVLNRHGVEDARIRFIGLVAAPEGVEAFHKVHPDVPLYVAALDDHLDDRAYIVPGLGDAGDRIFGTA